MAARTTRREARESILKAFADSLDKIIPADESVPLRGQTFLEWEEQADALRRAVLPTLLQERAALDEGALVAAGGAGPCPHCASDKIYLDKREERQKQGERTSPHGPVVLPEQQCRCRACGRSFSPSSSRLGIAGGSAPDAPGGTAGRAGNGGAGVRAGGAGDEL